MLNPIITRPRQVEPGKVQPRQGQNHLSGLLSGGCTYAYLTLCHFAGAPHALTRRAAGSRFPKA